MFSSTLRPQLQESKNHYENFNKLRRTAHLMETKLHPISTHLIVNTKQKQEQNMFPENKSIQRNHKLHWCEAFVWLLMSGIVEQRYQKTGWLHQNTQNLILLRKIWWQILRWNLQMRGRCSSTKNSVKQHWYRWAQYPVHFLPLVSPC